MMTAIEATLAGEFVVFCRVGGCLMALPGLGSERVPIRVRLYLAIAVSIAIFTQLSKAIEKVLRDETIAHIAVASIFEVVIGVLIGLTCRQLLYAAETMLTASATSIGLGNAFGAPINEAEPTPAISSLIVIAAVTLIFMLDLHLELLFGLRQSYDVVSVLTPPTPERMLREFLSAQDDAYMIMLRICSPFLIFGLVTNVAIGFLNRMASQAPVYFVLTPLLILAGVYWMYILLPDVLTHFIDGYHGWLLRG